MIEKETKKEILKFATKQTLKLHQNHTIEEMVTDIHNCLLVNHEIEEEELKNFAMLESFIPNVIQTYNNLRGKEGPGGNLISLVTVMDDHYIELIASKAYTKTLELQSSMDI